MKKQRGLGEACGVAGRMAATGLGCVLLGACGSPPAEEAVSQVSQAIWNGQDDCEPDEDGLLSCIDGSVDPDLAPIDRVRNGTVALRSYWPNGDGTLSPNTCTATLLTPQLVLTAAHCMPTVPPYGDLQVFVNRARLSDDDEPPHRMNAAPPPHLPLGSEPMLRRGPFPFRGTDDLALVFLDSIDATIETLHQEDIAELGPGAPRWSANEVLDWGFPVTLREEPVPPTATVELVGFGVMARPAPTSPVLPSWRQTTGVFNVVFDRVNVVGQPPTTLGLSFVGDPYWGVDGGDSGGPLFIWEPDGTRKQAGVNVTGCSPDRPDFITRNNQVFTSTAIGCTRTSCPGGYIDVTGQCTGTASPCPMPVGNADVPGIRDATGACALYVPSLVDYWGQPACLASNLGLPAPGYLSPTVPGQCDYVPPMQQCDGSGLTVVGDVCQKLVTNYSMNSVDVTSGDARAWILENGADPNRPGRLYGERDYAGACRFDVDSNCDRNFQPFPTGRDFECPNIFDASNGFDPELRGNQSPAVYGRRGVDIHDRVALVNFAGGVRSDVVAQTGPVLVRNDAVVGNVHGGDSFFFGWRATMGTVHATSCNGSCVNDQGGIDPPFSAGARVPDIRLTPTFPEFNHDPLPDAPNGVDYTAVHILDENGAVVCSGDDICFLYPNVKVNKARGQYWKAAIVHENAELRLGAGKHYFDGLIFYSGSKLVVDHSEGAVEIYVRAGMFWQGRVQIAAGDTSGLSAATVLGYYGSQPLHLFSSFKGVVVAPNARLELYDNTSPYVGQFFADQVVVRPDVRVVRQLCHSVDAAPPIPPSPVTAEAVVMGSSPGAYCAAIRVTNQGSVPTSDWNVQLGLNGATLNGTWNGTFSGTSGVVGVQPNFDWNHVIAPNTTNDTVGYCAVYTGPTLPQPTVLGVIPQF